MCYNCLHHVGVVSEKLCYHRNPKVLLDVRQHMYVSFRHYCYHCCDDYLNIWVSGIFEDDELLMDFYKIYLFFLSLFIFDPIDP